MSTAIATARPAAIAAREDLAQRSVDGLEVALLWDVQADTLAVAVSDARTGDAFELAVERDEAFEVFHHPYAYAAFRGVEYRLPGRDEEASYAEAA